MATVDESKLYEAMRSGTTVVVWRIKARYDYSALYIRTLGRWYIAGDSEWYGISVVNTEQLIQLIKRDECDRAYYTNTGWREFASPVF